MVVGALGMLVLLLYKSTLEFVLPFSFLVCSCCFLLLLQTNEGNTQTNFLKLTFEPAICSLTHSPRVYNSGNLASYQ